RFPHSPKPVESPGYSASHPRSEPVRSAVDSGISRSHRRPSARTPDPCSHTKFADAVNRFPLYVAHARRRERWRPRFWLRSARPNETVLWAVAIQAEPELGHG